MFRLAVPAVALALLCLAGTAAAQEVSLEEQYATGWPMGVDRVMVSKNLPGSDLLDFAAQSAFACAQKCIDNEKCNAFTFRSTDKHCWLKTRAGPSMALDKHISGTISRPEFGANLVSKSDGKNWPGSDIEELGAVSGPESCYEACLEEDACFAFSFRKSDKHCWLKAGKGNEVDDPDMFSGKVDHTKLWRLSANWAFSGDKWPEGGSFDNQLDAQKKCGELTECIGYHETETGEFFLFPEGRKWQQVVGFKGAKKPDDFNMDSNPHGKPGIRIMAWSAGREWGDRGSVEINGKEFSNDAPGFNVVVIDSFTGKIQLISNHDTSRDSHAAKRMARLINKVKTGHFVIVVVRGSATPYVDAELELAMARIGSEKIDTIEDGMSFAIIGVKGAKPGDGNVKEATNTQGRAVVTWTQQPDKGMAGQGLPGAAGDVGMPGKQGIPGPGGDVGVKGEDGDKGTTGPRGPPGPKGFPGRDGILGPLGPTGPPGPPGMEGDVGVKGRNGVPGSVGPMGEAGKTGEQGTPGEKGSPGDKGPLGEKGIEGPAGPPGPDGAKGPPGETGMQGVTGPQGETGKTMEISHIAEIVEIQNQIDQMLAKLSVEAHRMNLKHRIALAAQEKSKKISEEIMRQATARAEDAVPKPIEAQKGGAISDVQIQTGDGDRKTNVIANMPVTYEPDPRAASQQVELRAKPLPTEVKVKVEEKADGEVVEQPEGLSTLHIYTTDPEGN